MTTTTSRSTGQPGPPAGRSSGPSSDAVPPTWSLVSPAVMLFPFVYMVVGALKTPEDTFRYPPKILPRIRARPRSAARVRRSLLRRGARQRDRRRSTWPNPESRPACSPTRRRRNDHRLAARAGHRHRRNRRCSTARRSRSTRFSGGETVELVLVRNTAVGRFLSVDDPSIETFAVVRTATPAESIDPQWQNFSDIIELRDFDRSLTNTILVTFLVVIGHAVHLDHGRVRLLPGALPRPRRRSSSPTSARP